MNEQQGQQFTIGESLLVATINHIANSPTGQSSLAQVTAIVNGLRQLERVDAQPALKPTGRTMAVDDGKAPPVAAE